MWRWVFFLSFGLNASVLALGSARFAMDAATFETKLREWQEVLSLYNVQLRKVSERVGLYPTPFRQLTNQMRQAELLVRRTNYDIVGAPRVEAPFDTNTEYWVRLSRSTEPALMFPLRALQPLKVFALSNKVEAAQSLRAARQDLYLLLEQVKAHRARLGYAVQFQAIWDDKQTLSAQLRGVMRDLFVEMVLRPAESAQQALSVAERQALSFVSLQGFAEYQRQAKLLGLRNAITQASTPQPLTTPESSRKEFTRLRQLFYEVYPRED